MLRGVNTWADELCLGGWEAGVISMPVHFFVRLMEVFAVSSVYTSLRVFFLFLLPFIGLTSDEYTQAHIILISI